MITTFTFNTAAEDYDHTEYQTYVQAPQMLQALHEIEQQVRQWYKYDSRGAIPADEIMDKIYDIIQEEGVDMERMGY